MGLGKRGGPIWSRRDSVFWLVRACQRRGVHSVSAWLQVPESTYDNYVPRSVRDRPARPSMVQLNDSPPRWVRLKSFAPAAGIQGIWASVAFVLDMDKGELHMQVRAAIESDALACAVPARCACVCSACGRYACTRCGCMQWAGVRSACGRWACVRSACMRRPRMRMHGCARMHCVRMRPPVVNAQGGH